MEEILKIILSVIGAAGGVGAIIWIALTFSVKKIAERLEMQYQLKLNKELEEYKNDLQKELEKLNYKLDNKNHVSKVLFDIKVELYKKLSESFFNVVLCANTLIPPGLTIALADKEKQEEKEKEDFVNLNKTVMAAQNLLNSSIPFITEEQYEKYDELLKMARDHISDFSRRWCVTDFSPDKSTLPHEAYLRSNEMAKKFKEFSVEINKYLSLLEIIE